jgi:four helix bundle protein
MTDEELKARTKKYALRVIKLTDALPSTRAGNHIAVLLLRSGTSVGSNYRAVCRARSRADFIAKLGIVEEEADESLYWMELLIEAGLQKATRLQSLMQEGAEILAIVCASINTARARR